MTDAKAIALAAALGGIVVHTMPQSRMAGVALTRADGRYVLIEEDAAAVYYDEHACWIGYHTPGDDERGVIDACEWGDWGTETWAGDLASLTGGEAHNGWLLYHRTDGRFVVIGMDAAGVYQSREDWKAGGEGEGYSW